MFVIGFRVAQVLRALVFHSSKLKASAREFLYPLWRASVGQLLPPVRGGDDE